MSDECQPCNDTGRLPCGNQCQWCALNDNECRSCVNGKCVTGPECVALDNPKGASA